MSLRMLWRCNLKLVSSQTAQLRLHLCLGRSLNSMGRAKANLLILNSVTRSLSSNSTPYWVKGPIRTELYQTTTGEGLLNLSTKYKLSDKDMLILLSCLCRHKNTLKADFLRDPRLLAILQSLKNFGQTGSRGITAGDGVFTLRSLLHLGVSPSADVIVAYQQFIIRTINFLPVDSVALLAIFHRRFATSTPLSGDLQKQLEKFVVKNSKSLKDVSLLLPLVSEDLERLRLFEPLLLESLPQMKTVDLCRLLAAVGTLNYDSDVLVNNLTEVLCESTEVIPLKKVCACLQACERISCSPKLLERLLRDVAKEIPNVTSVSVISSLATGLGRVKYLDKAIVSVICDWISSNFDNCQTDDLIATVIMLGKLAYVPDTKGHQLLREIGDKILISEVPSIQLRLDFTWCLAVVTSLKPDFVYYFAQQDVCDQLLLPDGHPKSFANRAKLLNIFAAGELDKTCSQKSDTLIDSIHAKIRQGVISQDKLQKTSWLVKALESIAPKDRFLETNKITKDGYLINAELRIESNGVLIPRQQGSLENEIKIAFMVTEKSDYTKGTTVSLTGHNQLAFRHLEQRGYKVIEIKFEEVKLLNPLEKVKFLKSIFPSDHSRQVQSEIKRI